MSDILLKNRGYLKNLPRLIDMMSDISRKRTTTLKRITLKFTPFLCRFILNEITQTRFGLHSAGTA